MKDLFITKAGVAYTTAAGLWAADTITVGGLGFFIEDGTLVASNASNIGTTPLTINMMRYGSVNKQSIQINRRNFTYTKTAYAAPVAAVKVLGNEVTGSTSTYGSLNLPSSISVGDIVGVNIIDTSKPAENTNRLKEYSFSVTTGDLLTGATAANIITKLVALINADTSAIVTAVAQTDGTNNDGIKFTSDTAGSDFNIGIVGGVLQNADRLEYKVINDTYSASITTTPVANVPGSGTAAQILQLEKDSSTRQGNTRTQLLSEYMWSQANETVATATYTQYFLRFNAVENDVVNSEKPYNQVIIIAVPSGEATLIGILDAILAAVAIDD
jgi:hypothetical protein